MSLWFRRRSAIFSNREPCTDSRLGNSGLIVSRLSLGSWVTFGPQVKGTSAYALMKAAYDAGVNFFDNAETYSSGEAETISEFSRHE